MSSSAIESEPLTATPVKAADNQLIVELNDGRMVPVSRCLRLAYGTHDERTQRRFNRAGSGAHWPALDDGFTVANLVLGQRSGERQESFEK